MTKKLAQTDLSGQTKSPRYSFDHTCTKNRIIRGTFNSRLHWSTLFISLLKLIYHKYDFRIKYKVREKHSCTLPRIIHSRELSDPRIIRILLYIYLFGTYAYLAKNFNIPVSSTCDSRDEWFVTKTVLISPVLSLALRAYTDQRKSAFVCTQDEKFWKNTMKKLNIWSCFWDESAGSVNAKISLGFNTTIHE